MFTVNYREESRREAPGGNVPKRRQVALRIAKRTPLSFDGHSFQHFGDHKAGNCFHQSRLQEVMWIIHDTYRLNSKFSNDSLEFRIGIFNEILKKYFMHNTRTTFRDFI